MGAIPANIQALTFLEDHERVNITHLLKMLHTTPWVKDLLLVELRASYPEVPVEHPFAELSQLMDSYYKQVLADGADLVTAGPCLIKLSELLDKVNQREGKRTVALPGMGLLKADTVQKIKNAFHDRTYINP